MALQHIVHKYDLPEYFSELGLTDRLETIFRWGGFSSDPENNECWKAANDCQTAIMHVADYACGNYTAGRRKNGTPKVTLHNVLVACDVDMYKRCIRDISEVVVKYLDEYNMRYG